MKTTIVPAQITTVEDKIAGSLSLSQLLILTIPIFAGSIIYITFPPTLRFEPYKIVIALTLTLVCATLAIRIKGKILLLWTVIISKYNLRPRYYVANRNDTNNREALLDKSQDEEPEATEAKAEFIEPVAKVKISDRVLLESMINDPLSNLSFEQTSKGGMRVLTTEIK
jgi:hypothetical protein